MAMHSVSQLKVVPAGGVVVDASLHTVSAVEAIHQATCILEHLVDVMGFNADGKEDNKSFGQHLLFSQVTTQLRVAVDQMIGGPSE